MSDLTEGIIAGVVSGVILQIIAALFAGGRPSAPTKTAHIGDFSPGAVIDQREEVTFVQRVYNIQNSRNSGDSASDLDGETVVVLAAIGGFVTCLGFLYSWPVAVGVTVGSAVSVLATAVQMWRSTAGTAGPRGEITVAGVWVAALALVGSWWVVHGGPSGRPGMTDIEAAVVEAFPTFDDGLRERWQVIANDPAAVIQAMPWQHVLYLVLGLAATGAAVLVVAGDVLRWWSFRNVAGRRTRKPAAVNRARAYLSGGGMRGMWFGLVLISALALGCTSGYVGELFDWRQSRQLDQMEAR